MGKLVMEEQHPQPASPHRSSSPASSALDVIKEGWLMKQGGAVKTWKKRWFSLSGARLAYYDTDKKYKGDLFIHNAVLTLQDADKTEGERRMIIAVEGRDFIVASSYELLLSWKRAIEEAIQANRGSGVGPVSVRKESNTFKKAMGVSLGAVEKAGSSFLPSFLGGGK
mmetsp:Transcript_25198/g.30502  ORF Transcript_25198/g.30502 Transcript_25198/m.30502 type:complete len:168 (-) Transcript_25198:760-1263(-)